MVSSVDGQELSTYFKVVNWLNKTKLAKMSEIQQCIWFWTGFHVGPIQYNGKTFSVISFVLAWSIMILGLFSQLRQDEHSIFINVAVFPLFRCMYEAGNSS